MTNGPVPTFDEWKAQRAAAVPAPSDFDQWLAQTKTIYDTLLATTPTMPGVAAYVGPPSPQANFNDSMATANQALAGAASNLTKQGGAPPQGSRSNAQPPTQPPTQRQPTGQGQDSGGKAEAGQGVSPSVRRLQEQLERMRLKQEIRREQTANMQENMTLKQRILRKMELYKLMGMSHEEAKRRAIEELGGAGV